MTNADRRIAAIATGQPGTFSRAQATDSGLSDRQLRSRVQSGFLIRTGPNTFRVAGAPVTTMSRLRALLLDVGDEVWVSGPTAVEPIDRCVVDGFAITSGVRTVVELARTASVDELQRAVDSVFLLGLTNEDHLFRRIAALRSSGRYGIPALIDVLDRRALTGGTESWLEREYLRLLAAAGLPSPLTQQVVARSGDRLVRVDCLFPDTNLVVELLGYRYHRSRSDLTRHRAYECVDRDRVDAVSAHVRPTDR